MQPVIKHYVAFDSPGTFFCETTKQPISAWDSELACAMAQKIEERYGAKPFRFYFTTVQTTNPVKLNDGTELRVEEKQTARSGSYYLGGVIKRYEEIPDDAAHTILRSNMRGSGWWIVCETTTPWRSVNEFETEDLQVDPQNGRVLLRGDAPDLVAYRARKSAERDAEYPSTPSCPASSGRRTAKEDP